MKKERKEIQLVHLLPNTGQVDWLPSNPREWTAQDVTRTARSIKEDPDFLEDRPLLVFPHGEDFVVFAGNLRREGCVSRRMKSAPCVVYYPETADDYNTIKRRAMKDNGSFGKFDYDALANEWDDLPLTDYGIEVWDTEARQKMDNGGLSTEGKEGAEGYDEFVDKFEQKVTTDDCYTPPEVYDIVRDFVDTKVAPLTGRKIVRPFFPGGNYEDLAQYPKGCVVLDNPPFSLYSKIVRFYLANGIDFWLFGPNLTLLVANADVCFVVANAPVVYENGAVVSTGFVTNMVPGLRIWCEPTMRERIVEAQKNTKEYAKYEYPDNCVTSATLGKLSANGCELKIATHEAQYTHDLDGFAEIGKGLFGGGFILSTAAAERAAAERAAAERAAAERAATKITLSPREREIVAALDKMKQ